MDVTEFKQEYRLRQWGEIIKEQQQSGQTVKAWCSEKGISTKTYYYRLRKVREAICQNVRENAPEIAFKNSSEVSICVPSLTFPITPPSISMSIFFKTPATI